MSLSPRLFNLLIIYGISFHLRSAYDNARKCVGISKCWLKVKNIWIKYRSAHFQWIFNWSLFSFIFKVIYFFSKHNNVFSNSHFLLNSNINIRKPEHVLCYISISKIRLEIKIFSDFFKSFNSSRIRSRDILLTTCLTWKFIFIKGTVMQIEKALKNDRLRVLKVFWKFSIPTISNFPVIYPWNLLLS